MLPMNTNLHKQDLKHVRVSDPQNLSAPNFQPKFLEGRTTWISALIHPESSKRFDSVKTFEGGSHL